MTTPDQLFEDVENYRAVLSTETDQGSPDNENTYGAIRNCIETLTMHAAGIAKELTLTSDPNDDTDGIAIDTAANMVADSFIGLLAVIATGNGIGNIFYISANTTTQITCYTELHGDSGGINPNLYSAGVRAGDKIIIFYHFMERGGHTHDGKNSQSVELAQGEIKADRLQDGSLGYVITPLSYISEAGNYTWQDLLTVKIYIPASAKKLSIIFQMAQQTFNAVYYAYGRVGVDGIYCGTQSVNGSTSLQWREPPPIDISSKSGWCPLVIQGTAQTGWGVGQSVIGRCSVAFVQ